MFDHFQTLLTLAGIFLLYFGCHILSASETWVGSGKAKPNHLIHEKSPYLIQHAYNPVDWYPWGDDAINKAKRENKPILLSIGYSTCHWCHVMAHESFSDPKIAEIMNRHFVCIKLDREERPDLDQIYITAVSAMTGSAGWPLNVFLTPQLKPFYGGTYFPAHAKPGIMAWPDLLELLAEAWHDREQHQKLIHSADALSQRIKSHLAGTESPLPLSPTILKQAFSTFEKSFDADLGGFTQAPKFPSPGIQNFLLYYHVLLKASAKKTIDADHALYMAEKTLRAMAQGGLYDHLEGGFHRYSTDQKWHIPHFEKMLYDNAQLIINYLYAYQITGHALYKQVARETITYIRNKMTHGDGAFFSAEDADSFPIQKNRPEAGKGAKKIEGAFYVWDLSDVETLLNNQAANIFAYRFGLKSTGNAENDPQGEFIGKNILFKAHTIQKTAKRFNLPELNVKEAIRVAKKTLLSAREKRFRPDLDDKVITAWNGLMISALAKGYQVLGDEPILHAAQNAARFIRNHLYDTETGQLYRIWREGERKIDAMATDHAFLIQGLIDLYESDFDVLWLDWAVGLTDVLIKKFYDPVNGGFFMTAGNKNSYLIARVKETREGVIPSAGSVAALNLFRLYQFTQEEQYYNIAKKTVAAFAPDLNQHPGSAPQILVALGYIMAKPLQIIISGDRSHSNTLKMLKIVYNANVPAKTIILIHSRQVREKLARRLPFVKNITQRNGLPTAYLCIDRNCRAPITDPEVLSKQIKGMQKVGNHNT